MEIFTYASGKHWLVWIAIYLRSAQPLQTQATDPPHTKPSVYFVISARTSRTACFDSSNLRTYPPVYLRKIKLPSSYPIHNTLKKITDVRNNATLTASELLSNHEGHFV